MSRGLRGETRARRVAEGVRARDALAEETARAREYVANARALTEEDKQIIDALVGLEFGASAPPPKRDEVGRCAQSSSHICSPDRAWIRGRALDERPRSTNDRASPRPSTARARTDIILRRSFSHRAQGLDHIARQLGDGHEGDATCDVCGAPGDEDAMILCDGCDRGCARCENEREWMTREIFYVRSRGGKGRGGRGRAREGRRLDEVDGYGRARAGEGLEAGTRERTTRGGRETRERETDG